MVALQVLEIFCMYHEIKSVVYKTFNFERMHAVLGDCEGETLFVPSPEDVARDEKVFLPPPHLARSAIAFGSPGRTELDVS